MSSWARDFLTFTAHQKPTVGDMKTSAVNIDHMGWLLCDGRTLTVTDYYWLWQVIGYSYGSNDADTFNLPYPAGRVPGFIGQSVGNNWVLGDISGEEVHTLTIDEMPTHNHTGQTSNSNTGVTTQSNGTHNHDGRTTQFVDTPESETVVATVVAAHTDAQVSGSDQRYLSTITSNAGLHDHAITDPTHYHIFTTNNTGGSNSHNNMQPTIFVGNMFIYSGKATSGNYPYFAGGLF